MTFDDFIGLCLLAIVLRAVWRMYWRDNGGLYFTVSCDTSEFDEAFQRMNQAFAEMERQMSKDITPAMVTVFHTLSKQRLKNGGL